MVDLTFTNQGYLWASILVPFMTLIHFFTLRQKKADIIKFSNFEAIERVAKGEILAKPYKGLLKNKNLGLLAIRALIYSILILSASGATLLYQGRTSEHDYVFAIDASSSMLADDFKPTRFDAAKQAAGNFLELIPKGASIGIVTFASTSIIELKGSPDFDAVKNALADTEPHESGGTAIGDAIVTATNLFNTNKSRVIILLTDGQSNVGTNTDAAIEYAKQNDVIVHTIGVATKEGGNVSNLNLISKLDEELLKKVSDETKGKLFIASDSQSLNEGFRQVASSNEKTLSLNLSWILLVSAIALLGAEWIIISIVYKTLP